VVAKILEGLEDGPLPGTAQPGDEHELFRALVRGKFHLHEGICGPSSFASRQGNYELGSGNYEENLWGRLNELKVAGLRRERGRLRLPLRMRVGLDDLLKAMARKKCSG
jgi:hypothetical protein